MTTKTILIILVLLNVLTVNAAASGRRDSFEIKNKRWSKIFIEVEYIKTIGDYQFEVIYSYNDFQIESIGNNHIYEGFNYAKGRLSSRSCKEIYHYTLNDRLIDEHEGLTTADFIDSIPFTEQLKSILKALIIRDRKGNILLTLENITDDMITGGDGHYSLVIK